LGEAALVLEDSPEAAAFLKVMLHRYFNEVTLVKSIDHSCAAATPMPRSSALRSCSRECKLS
jgi:hypothetical protein